MLDNPDFYRTEEVSTTANGFTKVADMLENPLIQELLLSAGTAVFGYLLWRWTKQTHGYFTNTLLQGIILLR